jgi:GR25 family glycosyltransferase involved in LPS biosynthesis
MKNLNDYFSEIHCINLEKRNDRWKECEIEFKKHNLKVTRFSAFDGKTLSPILGLTSGQVGAIYSHAKLIEYAKDQNLNNILILEDDVEFHANTNQMFFNYLEELPNDWDMLFFGANHSENNIWMREPLIKITDHVYKIIKCYAIHCYAVNQKAYDKLIKTLSNKTKPSDVLISDIQSELNCYLFRPHLAWQRPSYSDIEEKFTDYSFLKN